MFDELRARWERLEHAFHNLANADTIADHLTAAQAAADARDAMTTELAKHAQTSADAAAQAAKEAGAAADETQSAATEALNAASAAGAQ